MVTERFDYGDRVRHAKRPEWGVGSVVKVEDAPGANGEPAQRVSVRFPAAGIKRLSTAHADLERVTAEAESVSPSDDSDDRAAIWARVDESDWLAPVTRRKIEAVMTALPEESRDPFTTIGNRLRSTLGLYRFDRTGHSLVEWAVGQTGLDDPLSRFNRHELERYFDRWSAERDNHLGRLLAEASSEPGLVDTLLADAPQAGRRALRRLAAMR